MASHYHAKFCGHSHCGGWDLIFLVTEGQEARFQMLSLKSAITRAYCSSLLHSIIVCNDLPFFKIFSNLVHFPQIFKYFALFQHFFLPFFWKIAPIPLLFRIGPDYCLSSKHERKWNYIVRHISKSDPGHAPLG